MPKRLLLNELLTTLMKYFIVLRKTIGSSSNACRKLSASIIWYSNPTTEKKGPWDRIVSEELSKLEMFGYKREQSLDRRLTHFLLNDQFI